MKTILFLLGAIPGLVLAQVAPFTVGNLLVTNDGEVHEYTTDGDLVQSFPVPHPDATNYTVGDVSLDREGRIHVFNDAPFDNSYISTFDPRTDTWSHTLADIFLGNISDGDVSIYGDFLFHGTLRLDLDTGTIDTFDPEIVVGVAESSVGRNGVLYSINSGSPRYEVQRTDPITLEKIGASFELRNSSDSRLDGRGLAATEDGTLYVSDWSGRIFSFDQNATYLSEIDLGAGSLLDLDLRSDGQLAAGGRFGDVVITDTEFSTSSSFNVGSGSTYVAWVEEPLELGNPTWWPGEGWSFMQWPYLYDSSQEKWRFFSQGAVNTSWHINITTGVWSEMPTTGGWLYFHSSPGFFYEWEDTDWHYYSANNVQWINDLNEDVWAVFTHSP